MTKSEALAGARHARQLLNKPKGWKVVLHSCGKSWYYHLRNGPFTLHASVFEPTYFALLSSGMERSHGGSPLWTTSFTHANPNRVIARTVQRAQAVIAEINRVGAHIAKL